MKVCTGMGQSSCQQGYTCQNGGCCPLPQCPNGQTAQQVGLVPLVISEFQLCR